MHIRETKGIDLNDILLIEREAFKSNQVAELVKDLLEDPSAKPLLSLIAIIEERAVGHILFTTARLSNNPKGVVVSILAPLAIAPDCQKQGIGGKLIKEGLQRLSKAGVDIVFVLGHPEYYPWYGFKPAGKLGFEAPYPIPEENTEAWMVQELRPDLTGIASCKVICSDALNKPEHWRE